MADKKISILDAIVSVDDADVLPIVDTSVATTKKINVSQVKALAPVQSVASKTGAVTLVKGDVGLGNVDNTADADKPVSTATQTALDAKEDTITGAATTITGTDLTASRALTSSATGKVEVSAVTSTELGYLDGVTSAIQTQLDGKLDEYDGTTYDVTALAAVTQAEYDAIGTKSATTLYFII